MTLSQRIRSAMARLHESIECTPLAMRMQSGHLTRPEYAALLGQLGIIHEVLERELSRHAEALPLYRPEYARSATIQADLACLAEAEPAAPRPATQRLSAAFQDWSVHDPLSLLGAFYVLEGSRMGSMMLVQPLAAGLGLPVEPGQGLDYHLDGMAHRPRKWLALKGQFDGLALTEVQATAMVAAAVATMQGLHDLYTDLSRTTTPDLAMAF